MKLTWGLLLICSVFTMDYEEDEGVLVLTDKNFDKAIEEFSSGLLIKFYAPWCGHCKKMAPEYAKAAQFLRKQDPPIYIAKCDATAETKTAERFGIKGFPKVKFFVNQEPIDFGGERTEKGIANWVLKKLSPPVHEKETLQEVQEKILQENVLISFFGSRDHQNFAAFENTCKNLDDINCYSVKDSEAREKFEVQEGAVVMLKNFDEGSLVYSGENKEEDILKWIMYKSLPSMTEFDNKVAGVVFTEGNPGLFLFRANDDNSYDEILGQVAPEISQKLFVTYSQVKDGLGAKLAKFAGLSDVDLPSIWIISPTAGTKEMKKYKLEKPISPSNIRNFVNEWIEGKLVVKLKSEPIPEEPYDGHVRVLVGKNFESVAYDKTKDVLVEFYAPWCGHCKKLAPEYEQAAQELKHVDTLVIAKCDSTANDVENVSVRSFPTLKFFPANSGKKIIDYNGPRTSDGIVQWLRKNVDQKIKEKEEL